MTDIINELSKFGVIPVVVVDKKEEALSVANALIEGGIFCMEVTFRTNAAEESIRAIVNSYPNMLVGAGTIISLNQAKIAVNAGAKFLVLPGLDTDVIEYCLEKRIPVFPGCITPTEIMAALKYGLNIVKFFPAEQFGGLSAVKALSGPFPNLRFIPTGGVDADNLKLYLESDNVFACGGTWIVNKKYVLNGEFEKIKELSKEAVELVKQVRGNNETI